MYVVVWEFVVRDGAERAFERLYGETGEWVALFRGAAGYRGTELLRDADTPRRYLTIDRWSSPTAYAAFRERAVAAYEALDRAGEGLTEAERPLGHFTASAEADAPTAGAGGA
jgi:heme-degrading monooxygenase HmoA